MMKRMAKGSTASRPRRFSVCVSTTPENRFASLWEDADGFAAALGNKIGSKTGRPVGIIFMQSDAGKGAPDAELKQWISAEGLELAPSLRDDYEQLAAIRPGNPIFDKNVRRYIADWKKFWAEYVPEMMKTKRVPDGVPWGTYPTHGQLDHDQRQRHLQRPRPLLHPRKPQGRDFHRQQGHGCRGSGRELWRAARRPREQLEARLRR